MIMKNLRLLTKILLIVVTLSVAARTMNNHYIINLLKQPSTQKHQGFIANIQFSLLRARAKLGDRVAQTNLGILLVNGVIPARAKKDQAAVALWEKAALKHDHQAQYELAIAYTYGLGVKEDFKRAQKYMEQAAHGHQPLAQCMLRPKSTSLDELHERIDACRVQFDVKAGLSPDPDVLANLGVDEMILGNPKSIHALKQADDAGSLLATGELAIAYAYGLTVKMNFNKAMSYLHKAADKNYPMALAVLRQKPRDLHSLQQAFHLVTGH